MDEPAEPHNRFAKIKRDLAIVKWMLGVTLAGVAFLMLKAFA
jgi:hypothetical protein